MLLVLVHLPRSKKINSTKNPPLIALTKICRWSRRRILIGRCLAVAAHGKLIFISQLISLAPQPRIDKMSQFCERHKEILLADAKALLSVCNTLIDVHQCTNLQCGIQVSMSKLEETCEESIPKLYEFAQKVQELGKKIEDGNDGADSREMNQYWSLMFVNIKRCTQMLIDMLLNINDIDDELVYSCLTVFIRVLDAGCSALPDVGRVDGERVSTVQLRTDFELFTCALLLRLDHCRKDYEIRHFSNDDDDDVDMSSSSNNN